MWIEYYYCYMDTGYSIIIFIIIEYIPFIWINKVNLYTYIHCVDSVYRFGNDLGIFVLMLADEEANQILKSSLYSTFFYRVTSPSLSLPLSFLFVCRRRRGGRSTIENIFEYECLYTSHVCVRKSMWVVVCTRINVWYIWSIEEVKKILSQFLAPISTLSHLWVRARIYIYEWYSFLFADALYTTHRPPHSWEGYIENNNNHHIILFFFNGFSLWCSVSWSVF